MMLAQKLLDFPEERARVTGKTASHIKHWFAVHQGEEFHVSTLAAYVSQFVQTAPASVDRVMRELRQHGEIRYTLLSRRQSLYRAE